MLPLPILNVRLAACSEDWQQMPTTTQGRYCAECDNVVLDFTNATQADLEAAQAAAPGHRVCGRFRQSQLAADQPAPLPVRSALRPKLRRFLVALVLVCGLGLTSGEAWAQVQRAVHAAVAHKINKVAAKNSPKVEPIPELMQNNVIVMGGLEPTESVPTPDEHRVYGYAEQMPLYKNGGAEGLTEFIQKSVRWPAGSEMVDAEGRVFIGFIIDNMGKVRDAKVLKGIYPTLDAEALRVIQLLDGQFEPGRQNNLAVDVNYIVPVTFERK